MRANLATKTVFERRDHAATIGVVLGVRRSHEHDVEWQPNFVTTNLYVALFEHVEQADLNSFGQVW